MRILHTADWHLGQTLHGVPRSYEHARFLEWLSETIEAEAVDALIVAGDVFDTAHPGAGAQEAYYGFLARCRERQPQLSIVVVGGNHDSPQRLDAPRALLGALDIVVVGGLPRTDAGELDLERTIVPLRRRDGSVGAQLIAVPFLRRGELALAAPRTDERPAEPPDQDPEPTARCAPAGASPCSPGGDPEGDLFQGYRELYRVLTVAAEQRRGPGQALIATGHCYMIGGEVSALSERKVQVGNQYALPVDIYPESLTYVALGHLHRAQTVAGRENVRYSGSPLPLSLAERDYPHQVLLVDLASDRVERVRPLLVPRRVAMWSVPEIHAPLAEVLARLAELPDHADQPEEERPFLEVKVLLEAANPRLRQAIEQAVDRKWARLVRIDARFAPGTEVAPSPSERNLLSIAPEDVFRAAYARARPGPVPAELMARFQELLEDVQRAGGEDEL